MYDGRRDIRFDTSQKENTMELTVIPPTTKAPASDSPAMSGSMSSQRRRHPRGCG